MKPAPFLLPFFLLISFVAFSQDETLYDNNMDMFVWQEKAKLHEISTENEKESAVIILDEQKYVFDNIKTVKKVVHKIIRVNNDKGVELNNKVYIPIKDESSLKNLKVRCISKKGEETLFDKDNLKRFENLDGMGGFAAFAIEGIEVGGEIEYYYEITNEFRSCNRLNIQSSLPKKLFKMEMVISKEFLYTLYTENPYRSVSESDSSANNNDFFYFSDTNVVKFERRDASVYKSRINYCFKKYTPSGSYNSGYYNLFTKRSFISRTKEAFSKPIKASILKKVNTKGLKKVFKADKKAGIDQLTKALNAVYTTDEEGAGTYLSDRQFARLASNILRKMNVTHSLYVGCNRYKNNTNELFDSQFSYYNIDGFLIYISSIDLLWDPTCKYCESYYVPYRYLGQELTFVGNFSGISQFFGTDYSSRLDEVPVPSHEFSTRKTKIDLTFDDDLTANYSFDQNIQGYYSQRSKSWFRYHKGQGERFEEYITELFEDFGEDPKVVDYKVSENEQKEMELFANLKDESIAKPLGDKIMFKIGSIIGVQSEMYDSIPRTNPIIQQYPKRYQYEIQIQIPEGYEFHSSENVKISDLQKRGEVDIAGWNSDFIIEGDQLIITITEFYNAIEYKVSEIPDYRSVINRAADFNKGVIFFKKK